MNCRLNGISFSELPHICKGEDVVVVREIGKPWDSEARPAYSVRLNEMHIGYIPLVETIKEEALKARDGWKKVWKQEFETLSKEELRALAMRYNEEGTDVEWHDWEFVGIEDMRDKARSKMLEAEVVEVVRDYLYVDIMRNHLTPHGNVAPVYYDEVEGRNLVEIGEICSLSVSFDIW